MSVSSPVVFDLDLPGLTLEAGARLPRLRVRGWRWGEAEGKAPTVLVVHALTGDMRVGGPGGWWEPVVGPGRALDPTRCNLLCFNNLGSCYGTTGPSEPGFPRRTADVRFPPPTVDGKGAFVLPDDKLPATITTWDMARMLLLALDRLGLERVHLAAGGSLGGMIVLCLAALVPARVERLVTFGAAAEASPWQIGWNHLGRQALLLDPGFPEHPEAGLSLARQIGHMSYRAAAGLEARQGRRMGGSAGAEDVADGRLNMVALTGDHPAGLRQPSAGVLDVPASTPALPASTASLSGRRLPVQSTMFDCRSPRSCLARAVAGEKAEAGAAGGPWSSRSPYAVETYLVHQGRKLVARFEAMSYLTQIGAMDHHDLARPPPAPDPHESWRPGGGWGTLRITASSLAVGIDSDVLFPPARMAELASTLAAAGRHAEYRVLSSPHGHDAFLIEWDQVGAILRRALELPRPSPGIGSGE